MNVHARLVILALLFLVGFAKLRADTYEVVPPPRIVDLRTGDQVIAVSAGASDSFPAQHVVIQLALLGHPTPVQPTPMPKSMYYRPSPEDCPEWLLRAAISPVTLSDLSATRHILEANGFADRDITTHLVDLPPQSCGPDYRSAGGRVGQILVAIHPDSGATVKASIDKLNALDKITNNLQPAGIALMRNACDAEQTIRRRAQARVQVRAAMLARIAGLDLRQRRNAHSAFENDNRPNISETLCGPGAKPLLSPDVGDLYYYPPLRYLASVKQTQVYAARSSDVVRKPRATQSFVESTTAPRSKVSRQAFGFHVPTSEPFVSAQGVFRALLRPDAQISMFLITAPNPKSDIARLLGTIRRQLRAAGIPAARMRMQKERLLIRIEPNDEKRIAAVRRAIQNPALYYETFAFVRDCPAAASAVARGAFSNALARAKTMALAAHHGIGALIGVNEIKRSHAALCGYGANATTDALIAALTHASQFDSSGGYAEFGSTMVVAWRLRGTQSAVVLDAAPQPSQTSLLSNADQAFLTDGIAVRGSASVAIDQRDHCGNVQLRALQTATINALESAAGASVRALIDRGTTYSTGPESCQLSTEAGPSIARDANSTSAEYSLKSRVLVITAPARLNYISSGTYTLGHRKRWHVADIALPFNAPHRCLVEPSNAAREPASCRGFMRRGSASFVR